MLEKMSSNGLAALNEFAILNAVSIITFVFSRLLHKTFWCIMQW